MADHFSNLALRGLVARELDRLCCEYGIKEPWERRAPISPALTYDTQYQRIDKPLRLAVWRPYTLSPVEMERIRNHLAALLTR